MSKSKISFISSYFSDPAYGYHVDSDSSLSTQKGAQKFGVVNEREVRAAAGLMFAIGLITMLVSFFTRDFTLAALVVPAFLLDFSLKSLVGPQASFIGAFVRPLICSQEPEWVGAIQKRFAWTLGMLFAFLVLVLLFVFDVRGVVVFALCSLCLVLMWLESAAGICLGCQMYAFLVKKGIIQKMPGMAACAGGACKI